MQTFLPYPDMKKSLSCLDDKRLGKQRVETMQILNALCREAGYYNDILLPKKYKDKGLQAYLEQTSNRWYCHPATKMWEGYENALKAYYNLSLLEWKARRFKNEMEFHFVRKEDIIMPHWFGDEAFHASHRSNLLLKKPDFYKQYGWSEGPDLPYIWPSGKEKLVA